MSGISFKMGDLKGESTLIFDSISHNGYPLLNALTLNYLRHGLYDDAIILTNNASRWKDVIERSTLTTKCVLFYHNMFEILSLTSLNPGDGLLVIDNLDFLLEKFGGKEVISLLVRYKVTLSLLHMGLHTESTLMSLKAISPVFLYLELIEGAYVATTFNARPPKLLKQLETYCISPTFNLTSTPYTSVRSNIPGVAIASRSKQPSSTFRLETNAEEEAVRTLVANPFIDNEESVSEYITGKGSSDSESDPDDDLNL